MDPAMRLPPEELCRLHDLASRHRQAVQLSALVGCFYCLGLSDPAAIKEWVDKGETALCPRCSIDAVLPGSEVELTAELLQAMKAHWFAVVKGEDT